MSRRSASEFAEAIRASAGGAGRLFDPHTAVSIGSAPGRLDVMGGIADYSGALVLQWPIAERTTVSLRLDEHPRLLVGSRDARGAVRVAEASMEPIADASVPYAELQRIFAADPDTHWVSYVAGVVATLVREQGVRFTGGAEVAVESTVPEGKGVSSSAAIEAATMSAVLKALQLELAPRAQALLCQRAENLVVGAPCGVMDQMAVICGTRGHLLALLCQPAELQGIVPLPDGLALHGIDSGIRHAVSGSDYLAVRVGAFMGYRVLADLAGLAVRPGDRPGHVSVEDERWGGYLANVGTETFQQYEVHIPNTLTGSVFLKRYGGTTDAVTNVDPGRCYAVWTPTAHPIYEHERVTEWAQLLREAQIDPGARVDAIGERLGALMLQSHASYSKCRLGSPGTDLLVELAMAAGPAQGIYGAKITGGGSGGTVALLTSSTAAGHVDAIAREYARRTGLQPYVFAGSSDGSATA
jgi:galactokinase